MTFPEFLVWVFGAFGIVLVVVLAAASIQNLVEILRMRRRHKAKMTTKTKLIILELAGGIFGWGWLLAVGAAIYFLVMAVGFEGSWTPFFVALVVSGLSKWLARGIENQKRLSGTEDRSRIVADFGEYIGSNPPLGDQVWDVKHLPHDKQDILDAICSIIATETDGNRLEALKASALFLADFQEGIGDKPLSKIGVDPSSMDTESMSDDDLKDLAAKIAGNPDRKRFETFKPLVEKDLADIQAKLAAAEKLRLESLETK